MYEIFIEETKNGVVTAKWSFYAKHDTPSVVAEAMIDFIGEEGAEYSYRIEEM